MRLSFLSIVLAVVFSIHSYAQTDYVVHTIKQKETLSGLAKQYHTTVGDIMRLNGMNSKSLLKIGQKIKIPSAQQEANTTAKTASTPVPTTTSQSIQATTTALTHTVVKGETLYSISKKYKITIDQLKQWNGIYESGIKPGQVLVVSTAPVGAQTRSTTTPVKQTEQSTVKADTLKKQTTNAYENNNGKAAVVVGSGATVNANGVKPEEKTYTPGKPDYGTEVQKATVAADEPASNNTPSGGFFAAQYNKTSQEISGTAGIFKSASGWSDKKYYVLMNNIDANTIVKITVGSKIIYAKVLGPLPEVKEDNGLVLRLSNAAAAELGINDPKFNVVVSY